MAKVKSSTKKHRRPQRPLTTHRNHPAFDDLYNWLLGLNWWLFVLSISGFYISLNTFFALVYKLSGGQIANAKSFRDIFFFSIQTLSTVGYGAMYPINLAAQLTVAFEVFTGLFLLALLTGLMYARFSRPTAMVIFSKIAVVCPFDGVETLMFRAANKRENQILEAKMQASLLSFGTSVEGHRLRRFYELKLTRSSTPAFGLSWLVMHPITSESPFYGKTVQDLANEEAEIWITLTGLDETSSQTIYSRCYYQYQEIFWDMRFVDLFSQDEKGEYYMDVDLIHDTVPFKR